MSNNQNPPVRKTSGVRQENPVPSPDFKALFKPLPDGKLNCGYLEIGEWDRQADSFPWEGQVDLWLGPDGQVWALAGSLAEIPEEKE